MSDIAMQSMHEVSKLLKDKKISSTELVDSCLKRTDLLQEKLNPYITLIADQARTDAKQAQAEIDKGGPKSPMHGIPYALKDLFYTKGILTSAGAKLLKDFIPDFDGTITARLKNTGAILMGKTNTHEWAFGPTGEDSFYGPTRNPWDPERISGGSSGGSAVAVATGMAYMAMGSDTGGSIRIPASLCGIVGFKPTYGLASLYGIIPLSVSLDHPGPLARSVMDVAITMDAITGNDPLDPCLGRKPGGSTNFAGQIEKTDNLRGFVLGIPKNFFLDKTDYGIEEKFQETVKKFEALGAVIRYIEIPLLDMVPDVSTIILFSEGAWTHKDRITKHPEAFQPMVLERIQKGMSFHVTEYIQAMQDRNRIISAWEEALKDIDAVIAPTLPITAYKLNSSTVVTRGKEEAARAMCTHHTRLANVTGGPALSIPMDNVDGLPTGLMIMGRNGDDGRVLEIGYAFEKHNPYPVLK